MAAVAYEEKSFVKITHDFGKASELDDTYEQVYTPEGLRVQLYPHQMTMVKAMVDVYYTRYIKCRNAPTEYKKYTAPIVLQTSSFVLADSLGSGKTICILAFILLTQNNIKAFPEHLNRISSSDVQDHNKYQRRYYGERVEEVNYVSEVTRRFSVVKRPAIVFVGSSVLLQWQTAIRTYTNLKVFTVAKSASLEEFYKKFKSGEINLYDIVLVKNGTVTKNFLLDDENALNVTGLRSFIDVVGKITADACWSLAVYDDFDTIKIDAVCRNVNALFSIYVSATHKEDYQRPKAVTYSGIADFLKDRSTVPLNRVMQDPQLFTNFRLRNTDKYIDASTKIPMVDKYKYVYANPDDNYMKLLGVMGEADAANIMEMLNGDAIGTAAETLGIVTNSVADIFQRVLDKKYEKYMDYIKIVEGIQDARKAVPRLEEHPKDRHTAAELEAIRNSLIKKSRGDFLKYRSDALTVYLRDLEGEYIKLRDESGAAVNRVKDNLKEGNCQVCSLPLDDEDNKGTVINKCCGLIVCSECCTKSAQITRKMDYAKKTSVITGKCPNCRADVDVTKDLIFVSKEFDLNVIMNAKGDEKEQIVPDKPKDAPVELTDEQKKMEEIKNPKLKALLKIIRGEVPDSRTKSEVRVKNLIRGTVNNPPLKATKRKVLLFANYNETLTLVENFLKEQGIEYLRLAGTYSQMHAIIEQFKNKATVLLINSSQVCAGLNLQFATDLVFFHKIIDTHCEEQVCGRAQRIGRTHNLQMHYLLYNNEQAMV